MHGDISSLKMNFPSACSPLLMQLKYRLKDGFATLAA